MGWETLVTRRKETLARVISPAIFFQLEPSTTREVAMEDIEVVSALSKVSSPSVLTEEHSEQAVSILQQSAEVASTSQLPRQMAKTILPEIIRPYPKAAPRKSIRRGRRPGKTKILTKTPEKPDTFFDHEPKKKKRNLNQLKIKKS